MTERKNDDPLIGKKVANYKVQRLLGKGGMSQVYLAVDENLDREVAVKIITLERDRAKELMKRFKREARIIGKLDKHPNIVTIYYYGEDVELGRQFFAMELIKGETLTQRMGRIKRKEQYMPYDELIVIMRQVASALDYAHKQGVIHRDIKPSNIMIEKDGGRAVLMDFGLVRDIVNESTLGTAFGTPRYIAPEQAISSQQAVPQSDIYAMGIILYELLTGQVPFDDESAMSLALSHITNPPPPPREIRPDLPEAASAALLKALEKEPEKRYKTATAMIEALANALGVGGQPLPLPSDVYKTVPEADEPIAKNLPVPPPPAATPPAKSTSASPPPTQPIPIATGTDSTSAKTVAETKDKPHRKFPLWMVGAILIAVLGIGGFVIFGMGGDDDAGESTSPADLRLIYNNDYMLIQNVSGETLDLKGFAFLSPDETTFYSSYSFGQTETLPSFVNQRCILIYYDTRQDQPAPELANDPCLKRGDIATRELRNTSRTNNGFAWVWSDTASSENEFWVIKTEPGNINRVDEYQLLQRCPISRSNELQECSVSWRVPPKVVPTVPPAPTATAFVAPSGATMRLVYSNDSLIIQNISGVALNIDGLTLSDPDNTVRYVAAASFFRSDYPTFPANRCIYIYTGDTEPDEPDFCGSTRMAFHSNRNASDKFWVWNSDLNIRDSFEVRLGTNGEIVQTCPLTSGECFVNWTQFSQ